MAAVPCIIVKIDKNCTYTWANEAGRAFFGNDFIGKGGTDYSEEGTSLGTSLEPLFSGTTQLVCVDNWLRRKDGSRRLLAWQHRPLEDETGRLVGALSTAHDITDHAFPKERLLQTQRLEAVGRLAGGVAHDFNNVLSVIIGRSDLMIMDLEEGHPVRDNAISIRENANRAATLTRQLLAFSRRQALQPKVIDLNDVITDLTDMLRTLIGEDVQLVTVPKHDIGQVKADPGQIEQVIVNLAVNSRDAMPDGGKLTIEAANVNLDEEYARSHVGASAGPHVMLAVTDTGHGMIEKTKEQLFEPFFTTKEHGSGTGLGLSTVYGIVKQSGGNIWVHSEVGSGTTFKVYLPRVDGPAEDLSRREASEEPTGGTETILVVEDEQAVREVVTRILRLAGYTVIEADDGKEALAASEEHEGDIQLVITDVVMPRMSAREMTAILAERRPGTRVLLTSGYTDNSILQQRVLDASVPFIQKPYTVSDLLVKVREVLDA